MCSILNNSIIKKLIVVLLVITLVINIFPNKVQAASFLKAAGGAIISIILRFVIFFGDTVLEILQNNFISTDDIVITAKSDDCETFSGWDFLKFIVGALIVVVSIVVAITSFGTLSWVGFAGVMAGIKFIGGVVLAFSGGVYLTVGGASGFIDGLQGEFDLPQIRYTPYEIFSNQIPLLDVNFIKPMKSVKIIEKEGYYTAESNIHNYENEAIGYSRIIKFAVENGLVEKPQNWNPEDENSYDSWGDDTGRNLVGDYAKNVLTPNYEIKYAFSPDITREPETYYVEAPNGATLKIIYYFDIIDTFVEWGYDTRDSNQRYLYQIYKYEMWEDKTNNSEAVVKEYKSSASILQEGIATWYKVLRRVALVGLLSVLLYVGIRIILAATAGDKAKYKKMFLNWVVAVCILFVLHYLMVFIVTMSEKITEIFLKKGEPNILVELPVDTTINDKNLPRC